MKLILINRERLQALGSFLVDEFDNIIARIRAAWDIEHTADGAHTNVNALTVNTGRLVFDDIAEVSIAEAQVNNFDPAGLTTASILRLDSSLTEVSITGLRVPQDSSGNVLDGRVLVVENITSTTTFVLEADDTNSSARNRFTTPWGPPEDSNSPLQLYLRPSTLTVLIYNAKKARWIVHSAANDASIKVSTLAGSQHDNVSTSSIRRARTFRVDFSAAGGSISGFDGTGVAETTAIRIVNAGLYTFSILHQNTSSSDGNRVQCPGGVRYMIHPREVVDLFKTAEGWRILEKADQWVDVTYAAGNFTTDAGTWTVDSGDQSTYTFQLDGNMMTVSFDIRTSSVATSPTQLRIAVPLSRIIARTMQNRVLALNAGTQIDTAYVEAVAGETHLRVFRDLAGTAWSNATDTTSVRGQIVFMVRDDCAAVSEVHTDVAHGDTSHSDVDHSDMAHSDVAHTDEHTDTPHSDSSHSDIAFVDVAHSDVAFEDVAHEDSAHEDVAHTDISHGDDHGDSGAHEDHGDVEHQDSGEHTDTHDDSPHSDVAHEDTAHEDVPHEDVDHEDVAHSDVAHSDSSHSDTAHADTHTDSAPHQDVAHIDSGHGDTAHSDSAHDDIGYHCDTSHSDI
jgi:hypothetical protein